MYYPNNLEFRVLVCSDFPTCSDAPQKPRIFNITLHESVKNTILLLFIAQKYEWCYNFVNFLSKNIMRVEAFTDFLNSFKGTE